MNWNFNEAISYYKKQGAPADQTALVNLLREIQQEHGGRIPVFLLEEIAQAYAIKTTYLKALIKRFPSLHLDDGHTLELCAGPNCGKHTALAVCAEKLHIASGKTFTLKFSPCMRMCGKGPNIKWDGALYHKADENLLNKLLKDAGIVFHAQP